MLMPLLCPVVSEYTGVDFSEDFITAARSRQNRYGFKNATFFCDDINHFCAERQKYFDAGFALDLSEHVPDGEWLEILRSIHSTLKTNSVLYLHTPNAKFFIEMIKKSGFILKQFPEHVAVRDAASNAELLQKAGFSTVKITFLPHYNVLGLIHPFSLIPIWGCYFQARLFIRAMA
jgi:cyclopropane fatty-acyl-phospholipid synthase-like methyltransferase